jgi:hypothetical protein
MNRKDECNNLAVATAFANVLKATVASPAAMDVRDCEGVTLLLHVGVGGITFDGTNYLELQLTASFDGGSTYEAVPDADVEGVTIGDSSGTIASFKTEHAAAENIKIGYLGHGTHLKIKPVFTGTHETGTLLACAVIKTLPKLRPVA